MKKWFFLFVSILIFVGVICFSKIGFDHTAPQISVNGTPELHGDTSFDDLLKYASAEDEHLKSLFIEENDLFTIVNKEKLTYVAIDDNNNVAKLECDVDVDSKFKVYHIEPKKELKLQVNTAFQPSDYFVLKNGCGWQISDSFEVKGLDNRTIGEYEIKVNAKKHKCETYVDIMFVDDFESPKIILKDDYLHNYVGRIWSDEIFLDNIEIIEDNKDSFEELLGKVKINWKDILKPNENGYVNEDGNYTVTYTVRDSDNHVNKVNIRVVIEKVPVVQEEPNYYE